MRYQLGVRLSLGALVFAGAGFVRTCSLFRKGGQRSEVSVDQPRSGVRGTTSPTPRKETHGIRGNATPSQERNNVPLSAKEKLLAQGEEVFILENHLTAPKNEITHDALSARTPCDKLDRLEGLEEIRQSYNEESPERAKLFTDCMDVLERAQQSVQNSFKARACAAGEQDLVHAMWDVQGDKTTLPKSAMLGLLSIVRSYPRGCVKLKVWVTNDNSKTAVQGNLGKFLDDNAFTVERLDFGALGARISNIYPDLKEPISKSMSFLVPLNNGPTTCGLGAFSNLVRVFVLSAYGGVYLDCNMVLLKPLTPLLSRDFDYRGSDQQPNTSAMHLRLGSPNAHSIMQWILEDISDGWQERLSDKVSASRFSSSVMEMSETIELLPSAYFDPVGVAQNAYKEAMAASINRYGVGDGGSGFYGKLSSINEIHADPLSHFFPGAFAFHFKNDWNTPFVPGSTADLLLDEYKHLEDS